MASSIRNFLCHQFRNRCSNLRTESTKIHKEFPGYVSNGNGAYRKRGVSQTAKGPSYIYTPRMQEFVLCHHHHNCCSDLRTESTKIHKEQVRISRACFRWEPTRDKVFLGQHHLGDRTGVYGERLEELWALTHGLGMLHDHPHGSRARPVGDLDPVATQRCQHLSWQWHVTPSCFTREFCTSK